jgi:vacuolar-type H+-ATPase subunit H
VMDDREYLKQLRRREKELLARIDKMRKTMDETVELGTLGFMSELLEQAKKELTRIQEKLRSSGSHED